jgi:hypothetical protein
MKYQSRLTGYQLLFRLMPSYNTPVSFNQGVASPRSARRNAEVAIMQVIITKNLELASPQQFGGRIIPAAKINMEIKVFGGFEGVVTF